MKPLITLILLLNLFYPGLQLSDGSVKVAVSIQTLSGIVRGVGGSRVKISVLLPEGVEPHAFQASSEIVEEASEASLLVFTGHFPFEYQLASSVNVEYVSLDDYKRYGLSLSTIPGVKGENLHGYWLKPENAIAIAKAVSEKLKVIDPGYADYYDENLNLFITSVKRTVDFMVEQAEKYGYMGVKVVVTFPSEVYIAESLGLRVESVIVKGENVFISGGELSRLETMLLEGGVRAILVSEVSEMLKAGEYAKQLSQDTGVPLIRVRAVSAPGVDSYEGLLLYNLGLVSGVLRLNVRVQ
ncbi:MAG TPA: hypothetical protein ENF42_00495, partial [Candidatus Bathyarchaeota archaeon]|nr:hypothetical protein [Candidatus Bathyarchaeota archaeon]